MQKKDVMKFFKKKGTIVAMSLCLVGAVAFATYYSMEMTQNAKQQEQNLVDLNEEPEPRDLEPTDEDAVKTGNSSDNTKESGSNNTADANGQDVSQETQKQESKQTLSNDMDVDPASILPKSNDTVQSEKSDSIDANSSNVQANINPTVDFGENNTLTWPVAGTVLIDYSMDSSVYFKTLNVYKYNPALIIGSEVDGQVLASAKGIVESIDVNEETGTTLTMSIGNNYELIYGQLKDVPVAIGDVVDAGSIIGYISEPTKYYCEEGSNLFFEMKKDGQPVDPFMYLE